MVGKILAGAIVVALIYFLFVKNRGKKPTTELEELVPCEKCGTYTSPKEAFIRNGKFYCSKECMK